MDDYKKEKVIFHLQESLKMVQVLNLEQIKQDVIDIGPWFHQIDLGNGILTRSISPTEGPQPLNHPHSRWEILKKVLPENLKGLRVLDIGCADGFFALELARRGAEVVAIDAAASRVRRLNYLIKYFGLTNISAEVGRLEDLQDSQEKFDFVFMIALLYHLKDPLQGLEIMAGITDKLYLESALHLTNEDSYMFLKPPQEGNNHRPKWFPTEKCVFDLLKYVGFSEIQTLERPRHNRGIYIANK